jgi:hypothetical protein
MEQWLDGNESMLEVGLVVLFGLMVGAVGILVGGRVVGSVQRLRRHGEPPPSRGEIPVTRHKGTAVVAAR